MPRKTFRLAEILLLLAVVAASGCPTGTPVLFVSPSSIDFGADPEDGVSETFTVSNRGTGTLTWSITNIPSWLTVSPSSGSVTTQAQTVTITLNIDGVALGTYSQDLRVTSNDGNQDVAVRFALVGPSELAVAPESLAFGMETDSDTFTISNTGTSALDWSISLSPSLTWLSVSATSGTLAPSAETEITAMVDRSGLSGGEHSGFIPVVSDGGQGSISVTVEVPEFSVEPDTVSFGYTNVQDFVTFSNHADTELEWTTSVAPAGAAWLTVTPDSDATPRASEDDIVLSVDRTGLSPGDHQATVTFATAGHSEDVTVSLSVPTFELSTELLDLGSVGEGVETATFSVTNLSGQSIDWTAEALGGDPAWLSFTPVSGALAALGSVDVTVSVDATGLEPGDHEGALAVTSSGHSETLTIQFNVLRPATLSVAPRNLRFGVSYTEKLVAIWNAGIDTVDWSIDTSGLPAWLTVTPDSPSGSVSGAETDAIRVSVDRTDLAPGTYTYDDPGIVVASNVGDIPLTVSMIVAEIPVLRVDTGGSYARVDDELIPLVTVPDNMDFAAFAIFNDGTGSLDWRIETTEEDPEFPDWIAPSGDVAQDTGIVPIFGSVAADDPEGSPVRITITREGISSGGHAFDFLVHSNGGETRVRVVMTVPKHISIGTGGTPVVFDLASITEEMYVANMGEEATFLDFYISEPSAKWLFLYPQTGRSVGTSSAIKDWQTINFAVDRGALDTTVATLTVYALGGYDDDGEPFPDESIEPVDVTITVTAYELYFELARARRRIPSLLRFPMLMRNRQYQPIPIPFDLLDTFGEQSFFVSEQNIPLELSETNQFLALGASLRRSIAIVLDYSGSMYEAAQEAGAVDPALDVSGEADPLQAVYERCVPPLIDDLAALPGSTKMALMAFHDRSQPARIVQDFTDEPLDMHMALAFLNIQDHGATELLPAINEAAYFIEAEDRPFIDFDTADIRAIVLVSDGRLTTPPGTIKDTSDLLYDILNVRLFSVGWGKNINHEPLARIAAASGGHYYPTYGDEEQRHIVDELYGWLHTEDPLVDACDQSVAKDIGSHVVFSYVTLTEATTDTSVSVEASFDNPNEDDGVCAEDAGVIEGYFAQQVKQLWDYAGDVRMGQISMRSSVNTDGDVEVVLHAEYIPRNIDKFTFTFDTNYGGTLLSVEEVALEDGGLIELWPDPVVTGAMYEYTAPADTVLKYGAFGDLVKVTFTPGASPCEDRVLLTVDNDIYAADPQPKYFIYPDSVFVGDCALTSFAPAFPAMLVKYPASGPPFEESPLLHFGDSLTSLDLVLNNFGGQYPYGGEPYVYLLWTATSTSIALQTAPEAGAILNGTTEDVVMEVRVVDRTGLHGAYVASIEVQYIPGNLSEFVTTLEIPVTFTINPPSLAVDTNALDFGDATDTLEFNIINAGQSTLTWSIDDSGFPDWLSVDATSGAITSLLPKTITVTVDRTDQDPGALPQQSIIVEGYDQLLSFVGSETITVDATVP
ncbi:MAG TPA: choice-of-anchor D domain-containing protein [Candidatus Hydrogenedentes bacterium]|nr:choice-of-anchor D domain-containing protein [Candidatus Hydrogenedentota bacterium]